MPTRKSNNSNDQIESLRDDVREDVRELHQKIEDKVEGIRQENKADLDKQSEKLEKRASAKFKEVADKIDKVHDCVHLARKSISELQQENAVAHERVDGELKGMNDKIDAAEKSRKVMHEKFDALKEDVSAIKHAVTPASTQEKSKSEAPILEAIRKRALTVLGIVGTTLLIALCLIILGMLPTDLVQQAVP